ncbi:hypothetical protein JCM14469_09220 [Desulfatiferula olefinivorans]
MTRIIRYFPYQFGTCLDLDSATRDRLIRLFEKPPMDGEDILGGRAQVAVTHLDNEGPVIIKYYKRGGLMRHLSRDAFFRSGKPRPRLEYEMLEKVRNLGIPCPEPLIWAIRGSMFYRAFLITRTIENNRSLIELFHDDETAGITALQTAADHAKRLIEHHIHHVDLHPGNVLVDESGTVYLIDFDKACDSRLSKKKLTRLIARRWQRAVKKHALPPAMGELFAQKLLGQ